MKEMKKMKHFYPYCLIVILTFWLSNLKSQILLNVLGGNQSFYSSDWNKDLTYSFSFKSSVEIPIYKKHKILSLVPNIRYQTTDLAYDYISYEHKGTRTFFEIINQEFYEIGKLTDVKIEMNKFLFGIAFQSRIIDELYLNLGPGVSLNTYKNLYGLSESNFHNYQIDLSSLKLPSNWNIFYSANLIYRFPITERFLVLLAGEFIYHQAFSLDELYIEKITQNSFHLEIGAGYRL